ncbi:MAG: hypothetical protein RLN86_03310 [Cyclobacteriaceae bacterium]
MRHSMPNSELIQQRKKGSVLTALLLSRSILFFLFQGTIAIALNSWIASQKYWIIVATAGNLVSISLLYGLYKREGKTYLAIFTINKENWKEDLKLVFSLSMVGVLLVFLTPYLLSTLLWSEPTEINNILTGSVSPPLTYFLIVVFPVTMALAELATYFGYVMPRLATILARKEIAILVPVLFLSIQHCFLPLVFDIRFIIYRGFMYLPFALLLGLALWRKPRLLPYFAILHGFLDLLAVLTTLQVESST